jgi:hypothetical protein
MPAESPPSVRAAIFARAAHYIAAAIVGRDCRFAGLAIGVITVAQLNQPARALATGGILNLIGGGILLALAWRTPRWEMTKSEVWRSMKQELRLAPEEAAPVLRSVLRATYLRFAGIAAWAGAWFLAMAGVYSSIIAWALH